MTWNNDMSAAPLDTSILAYAISEDDWENGDENYRPMVIYRTEWRTDTWWLSGTMDCAYSPTHWMHLPTPPQEPDNAE